MADNKLYAIEVHLCTSDHYAHLVFLRKRGVAFFTREWELGVRLIKELGAANYADQRSLQFCGVNHIFFVTLEFAEMLASIKSWRGEV